MAKNWWFKFEYRLWQSDADLSGCSLAARGLWLEILCYLYAQDEYTITTSYERLGRMARCDSSEVAKLMIELKDNKVCNVTLGHGDVTVVSRRLQKILKARKQATCRKQKQRVTAESQDRVKSKSNKKEIREEKIAAKPAIPVEKKKPLLPKSEHEQGMAILQKVIGKYPDGGAQGKALKWMLESGATIEQIEREMKSQHAEYSAKGIRASYLSLQKTIFTAKAESPPGDIMGRDYPGADHVPFDVAMPLTYCETRERYIEIRDEWLTRNAKYADEVADYERSRDFRERFSEEIADDFGASSPTGRRNGNGSQENAMPVS